MGRKRKPSRLCRNLTVNVAFLLFVQCAGAPTRLRGSLEELDLTKTLLEHSKKAFFPLDCNSKIDQEECQPWSSVFGGDGSTIFNRRIVIPCGECISIDPRLNARELVLNDGLDIQGKLVFPPNVEIKVKTTSILVQGELHMYSDKAIDGLPTITVTWMDHPGTLSHNTSFRKSSQYASRYPCGQLKIFERKYCAIKSHNTSFRKSSQYASRYPCGQLKSEDCNFGDRPFVVAGGRVVIQGLPSSDMPTWVPLLDIDNSKTGWHVEESEYEAYSEPKTGCPSNGILLHHRFTMPPPDYIVGSRGSISAWTGQALSISQGTGLEHGLIVDTNDIRHCLSPKVTYLITATVRLPRGMGPTTCARTGKNCISLISKYNNGKVGGEFVEQIWVENESHQFEYGQNLLVHAFVSFVGRELDETTANHLFQIQGPPTGDDFELLEFTMETPPREAFVPSQKICSNLVPGNNRAELFDFSSFPFRTNSEYVQIQTRSENSNKYFAITGREFVSRDPKLTMDENWSFLGISWKIPPSCVRAKATYRFRAKVRVHSENPITIKWSVRGWEGRHSMLAPVALCPPSQGEWVLCHGSIIDFPNEIVHSHRLEVVAESLITFRHDYDVDDLSFELMEGPVDRLLLPISVHNKWLKGAHLLITSSSPAWDEWEVVQIKDVIVHNNDSVKVEISRPIKSPVTSRVSEIYATEVALLSRNIVFENGGHFTILRTQRIAQVIEGADFSRFGIAGHEGRYPIQFDDCGDAEGTVISKNTIRHSHHRAIVLRATNNIRVTANVAFNTTGHCFVLESGIIQGNLFESNLAAYTASGTPHISSDDTSDYHLATFLMTNSANSFVGNIATGTDGHGFSLQLDSSENGLRHTDDSLLSVESLDVGVFENNTIHSVSGSAMFISGYRVNHAKIIGLRTFLVDSNPFELVDSDKITIVDGIFDKEVSSAFGISFEDPSIIDVRGCTESDDEAIANMNAMVDERQHSLAMIAPSAPSVFGLQDIET